MHGLICKAVEGFVKDQHGLEAWAIVRARAELPFEGFEALRLYEPVLFERMLVATAEITGRDRHALFEDIGQWVCTHPPLEPVRRLIRFTGATFVTLLYALDEIHERARMAVPGLDLPRFRLTGATAGEFEITSDWSVAGGAALLTGALRAMADDYGTLALIEPAPPCADDAAMVERIVIRVVADEFHKPREFTLGGAA